MSDRIAEWVAYQEGPYSPTYYYEPGDMEDGDPNDPKWRGYLRTSYRQPKSGAIARATFLVREDAEGFDEQRLGNAP